MPPEWIASGGIFCLKFNDRSTVYWGTLQLGATMIDFGKIISSYTREQAIEDRVLIDVSESEAASLFKFPAAITMALHSALKVGEGMDLDTYNARLYDVFYMMLVKARRRDPGSDVFFRVKIGRKTLALWGNCGPGDDTEPVITVGFPEDR